MKPKNYEKLHVYADLIIEKSESLKQGLRPTRQECLDLGVKESAILRYGVAEILLSRGILYKDLKTHPSPAQIKRVEKYKFNVVQGFDFQMNASQPVETFVQICQRYTEISNKPLRTFDLTPTAREYLKNRKIRFTNLCAEHNIYSVANQQYSAVLLERLQNVSGYRVEREVSFPWSKAETRGFYRYDGCIRELKILIEIDGASHYSQNLCNLINKNLEEQKRKDSIKSKLAVENGYKLYRFNPADDVSKLISVMGLKPKDPNFEPRFNCYLQHVASLIGKIPTKKEYDEVNKKYDLHYPCGQAITYACGFSNALTLAFPNYTPYRDKEAARTRILNKAIEIERKEGLKYYSQLGEQRQTVINLFGGLQELKDELKRFLNRK